MSKKTSNKKVFILDTSVLLFDSECLSKFQDNHVAIPITVLEELDTFKVGTDTRNFEARRVIKTIDKVYNGSSSANEWVPLGEGLGKLMLCFPKVEDLKPTVYEDDTNDNKILQTAIYLKESLTEYNIVFVTKDINLRIKARTLGMVSEDYKTGKVKDLKRLSNSGKKIEILDFDIIEKIYSEGTVLVSEVKTEKPIEPIVNSYYILNFPTGDALTRCVKLESGEKAFKRVDPLKYVSNIKPKNSEQKFALDALTNPDIKLVALEGVAGTGKANPLSEPILTPEGWITMGEVKPGTKVVGSDGQATEVLSIHPQGHEDIYTVTFSDGSKSRCTLDHLWDVRTSGKSRWETLTLRNIIHSLKLNKELEIPLLSRAVSYVPKEVPVEPYLLGVLLGFKADSAEIPKFPDYMKSLINMEESFTDELIYKLSKYNLVTRSSSLYINNVYLNNSPLVRHRLLQGLLDTEGFTKDTSTVYFPKPESDKLVLGIIELVNSLGGVAVLKGDNVEIDLPKNISPFRNKLKEVNKKHTFKRPSRAITSITKEKYQEECQCIVVEAKDSLYVTKNHIITHNTLLSLAAALESLKGTSDFKEIILARPIVALSNQDLGFLPGDLKSKVDPYMQPLFDNLKFIKSSYSPESKKRKFLDNLEEEGLLSIIALAFIRGRSISDTYFIVDECQNLTPHEVKTIVTRAGKNCKIIFTGDIHQIDSPYMDYKSNGLTYLIDKCLGNELFSHIKLEKGERSELANMANKLL